MTVDPNQPPPPSEPTEADAELQRRCRCGRELKRYAESAACIGCDQPEEQCGCGPND